MVDDIYKYIWGTGSGLVKYEYRMENCLCTKLFKCNLFYYFMYLIVNYNLTIISIVVNNLVSNITWYNISNRAYCWPLVNLITLTIFYIKTQPRWSKLRLLVTVIAKALHLGWGRAVKKNSGWNWFNNLGFSDQSLRPCGHVKPPPGTGQR